MIPFTGHSQRIALLVRVIFRDRRRSERITRERVLSESRFGAEQPCSANSKARSVHSLLLEKLPLFGSFPDIQSGSGSERRGRSSPLQFAGDRMRIAHREHDTISAGRLRQPCSRSELVSLVRRLTLIGALISASLQT